jgi:nitroreductase
MVGEKNEASAMDIYEALYTTRAMRRLRPEPIPYEAQARLLDAAIRAPSPGNGQPWRFVFVDDPALKARLATLYQEGQELGLTSHYAAEAAASGRAIEEVAAAEAPKLASARYLAEHWVEVPLFLFGFVRDDVTGSAIWPALWSAMLAARAEGIGSTITTLLSQFRHEETLALLGVPGDEGWTMAACIAMGYPLGTWGVAAREPVDAVAARNRWDGALGFSVPEPLWSISGGG